MYMSTTPSNGPIYLQVQEHLQSLLDAEELQPGQQIPSERALMAAFETSNMPVRQAIQHFIDKGIFERIHGRGTFVKKQDTTKTNRIAMLYVYDNAGMWASPFYTQIMRGIEDVSIAQDKRLILQSVGGDDIYSALCRLEDDVDGFLLVDLFPSMVERVEKYIREKRKPLVIINYPHAWSKCSAVVTDNNLNSYKLTEYLINKGHKQIALFYHRSAMADMKEVHPTNKLKHSGYRDALELNDLEHDNTLVFEVSRDNCESIISELKERGVTAIYCNASSVATGVVIPSIKALGYKIPQDFSIVAYDNTSDTQRFENAITCIDTDISELGQHATRCLLGKIDNPQRNDSVIQLQGEVLERSSVKEIGEN